MRLDSGCILFCFLSYILTSPTGSLSIPLHNLNKSYDIDFNFLALVACTGDPLNACSSASVINDRRVQGQRGGWRLVLAGAGESRSNIDGVDPC